MNQAAPASGLLPALIAYYHRLEADPNAVVADFGFSIEKIHAQVVLEPDGSLFGFEDVREEVQRGKKKTTVPRSILVPDGGGRAGTGMKPFFCWDNTGYALGRDTKGNPSRAAEMFAAFRDLHHSFRDELSDDVGFAALCRFLDGWEPARAAALPNWEELAGLNVVFRLRGRAGYVHQSEKVKAAWLRRSASDAEADPRLTGLSLVSGERDELARLHPSISGVAGANTTGAAIVSFNLNAFESYGKSQSYNAPVGVRDAFRYTTALNRLLADDSRRVRIGDATVVFWSDRETAADAESVFTAFFADGFNVEDPAEHKATVERVEGFLKAAQQVRLGDAITDPEAPFYVLGLSPNASRLNVRYWLVGTVHQFAERLATHVKQLDMIGARQNDPLFIRRLLLESAREPKDIPPQLAGEFARAVLSGLRYPQAMFGAIIRRIRADARINHPRAAILKAFLIRNFDLEVPVALDKNHPDEAYQLGRLFATLEKTQEDATDGKLNTTIKDRFFGSAAATPASVFPRLLQLHHHHMRNLEHEGHRIARGKLLGEIVGRIASFPRHQPLERQGLFYIGYYHQRQDFFTPKSANDKDMTNE
ncbi:type I-C CRISPR-associated protein Cas8c/Csd1 [Paludisphaera rhizosphaerae]|uniref:type I-C CRISPR-associated protein Cas8c/Csd1 n=1 Tax=Paludisphaera rhizosphaerae TaxID=2711216 RepID=UPI0013EA0CF3|nr:type I-C CRISPR-associated protein Cas8c/Csd1 [Paludisphaera rhizosphaerae]